MIKQFILAIDKIKKFAHTERGKKVITFIQKRKHGKWTITSQS